MKKILIIIWMLNGVTVGAVITVDSTGSQNNGGGADSSVFSGGADSSVSKGGVDANIMLGGSDSNSAVGAGLNQGSNSELYQLPKHTPGGSGVPKLSLEGIVLWLVGIMNQLVYVIIGAALVMFLYGILKLSFVDGQKPEAREQARKFMFWGIVSLFVMVSVWGLVRIFQFTLFGSGNLIVPQLK
jgi:hypothetical protein